MNTNGPASMITLRAVTVQQLIDTLAGKPGATLEDVTVAMQLLAAGGDPAGLAALINAAVGGLQTGGGLDEAAVNALIETQLTAMGPVIQQAVASQVGRFGDKVDFNVTVAGDGPFVVQTNNLAGAQHTVGIDFRTQRDGQFTVNGKRVLTVDDALAAGGAGIDQAAVEAAVDKATAELRGEIGALRSELADYKAFVAEQLGNFNEFHESNNTDTAQVVLAEQAKLQRVIDLLGGDQTIGSTTVEQAVAVFTGLNTIIAENIVAPAVEVVNNRLTTYLDALAGKPNPTPTEVRRALDEIAEYAQQVEQWANQTISDVVDYVAVEFTKYTTKDEFTALNTELEGFANEAVPAMVQSELENRIPAILEALQTHLENVLAIFGGGGGTGVTPAQITELTAEFARLYATKQQLDTAIDATQTLLDGKADTTELSQYAKLDDGNQEINAGLVKARGVQFTINDEVLVPLDFDDYGTRLSLIPQNAASVDEAGIVVVHNDLADLLPVQKDVSDQRPTVPTIGRGQRDVEITSDEPVIEWMHTPKPTDDFVVIFIGLTIPETVPGGSQWATTLTYGDQKIPLFRETLTTGQKVAGQDNNRGHIQVFAAPIPRDVTRTPQKVRLHYKTGRVDTYTLRGNSFTMTRVGNLPKAAGSPGTFSFAGYSNSPNKLRTVQVASSPLHRLIGCTATATNETDHTVTGNELTVLWRDNSAGRPFTVWTAPGDTPTVDVTISNSGAVAPQGYFTGTNGLDLPNAEGPGGVVIGGGGLPGQVEE